MIKRTWLPASRAQFNSPRSLTAFWAQHRGALPTYLALGLILGAFVFWRIGNLEDRYTYGWDEGAYLGVARLMTQGFRIHTDIFFAGPPFYLYALAAGFKLFGATVPVGRGVTLLFGVIGLIAIYRLAARVSGRIGGLAAVLLLALNPGFFLHAWTAFTEVPAVALSLSGLALALPGARAADRRLIAASGFLWALGVLTKPLVLPFGFTIVAVMLEPRVRQLYRASGPKRRQELREIVVDLVCFSLAALVPPFLWFVQSGPAIFSQVVETNALVRNVLTGQMAEGLDRISSFLQRDSGMLVLSGFGFALLLFKRPWFSLAVLIGWVGTVLLEFQTPPYYHHLVVLLPWLALFAGGLVGLAAQWITREAGSTRLEQLAVVLTLFGFCAYGYFFDGVLGFDSGAVARTRTDAALTNTIRWLASKTNPGEFILTDEPMLAFRAGRNLPPPAAVPAGAAISIGTLTTQQLIQASRDYQVRVIVVWERYEALPDWIEWVQANYGAARSFTDQQGKSHTIYVRMQ